MAQVYRILLGEDNPADAFLFQEALLARGILCDVQVISAGDEVLDELSRIGSGSSIPPDVIVLDLNLPKLSGIEVLERVKGNATVAKIPVAVMTSSRYDKDQEMALRAGATAYILKPSELADFARVGDALHELLRPNVEK